MTASNLSRQYGKAAICFGLAGTLIYLLMINVTLPHIEAVSGQVPFDMRPFGYGLDEAKDLLEGLQQDGRRYYLTRQIPLDTVYPALLALTLISTICWIGLGLPHSKLVRVGIAFSVAAAFFDYAENLGVAVIILNWPNMNSGLVDATSTATVLKSCSTVAAVSTMLVLAVLRFSRRKVAPD